MLVSPAFLSPLPSNLVAVFTTIVCLAIVPSTVRSPSLVPLQPQSHASVNAHLSSHPLSHSNVPHQNRISKHAAHANKLKHVVQHPAAADASGLYPGGPGLTIYVSGPWYGPG